MEIFERPPNRFGVFRVHRPVGLAHRYPTAEPRHHSLPLARVTEHRPARRLIKLGNAQRFNIFFMFQTKFPLHQILNRQAVTIPTPTPPDALTQHCLVTRDDIFYRTGEQVAVVRQTGGEGRAVVENKVALRLAAGRPLHTLFKNFPLLPKLKHRRLALGHFGFIRVVRFHS